MNKKDYLRDMLIGFGTLLFAVAYLALSQTQVSGDADGYDNITSRTFPYIIGGFLLLLGTAGFIQNIRKYRTAPPAPSRTQDWNRLTRVCIYTTAMITYALSIYHIGYLVSTFIMLVFGMWFSGARVTRTFFITAFATPPALYYFFTSLMQIPLPRALLL